MAHGQLPEAEVELRMLQVERALEGGAPPTSAQLLSLLARIQAWEQVDPRSLLPLRHGALVFESLGNHQEAMTRWGSLLRALGQGSVPDVLRNRMASEALEARERMLALNTPDNGR